MKFIQPLFSDEPVEGGSGFILTWDVLSEILVRGLLIGEEEVMYQVGISDSGILVYMGDKERCITQKIM